MKPCGFVGHRWAPMVTVSGDLCLRCDSVRIRLRPIEERLADLRRLRAAPVVDRRKP